MECAVGALSQVAPKSRPLASPQPVENSERTPNGYTGQRNDFHHYAMEYREMQILEECFRNGGEEELRRRPPQGLTPLNIRAVVMWYFAKVTGRSGVAIYGCSSRPLGINL